MLPMKTVFSGLAVCRNNQVWNLVSHKNVTKRNACRKHNLLDSPDSLNACQRKAVRFVRARPDVAVIHGPPGTGKTTTLVEIIQQAVKDGQKVLVMAPSNTAVDNVLKRLVDRNVSLLRLGNFQKMSDEAKSKSVEGLYDKKR